MLKPAKVFLALLSCSWQPQCDEKINNAKAQADHSMCSCLRRESMRVLNKALKIAHLKHVLVLIPQES